MNKGTTIVHVAEHAGVSISTVSRVLNGSAHVNPDIEQRVRAAMAALHYVPSASARNMKGRHSLSLGILLPQMDNDFFAKMLSAAVTAAEGQATVTVFSADGDPEREKRNLRAAIDAGVSALLYCPVGYVSAQELYEIVPKGFPLVIVYRRDMIPGAPHIYHDNVQGAEDATRYLLRLGRRKIAFFAGFWGQEYSAQQVLALVQDEAKRGAYTALDRLQGYMNVLQDAGIPLDPALIVPCWLNRSSGYEQAQKFLATLKDFDAILCGKDEVAAGILLALNEQKIAVPDKVSIVSFDDSVFSVMTRPMLTTVRQEPGQIGRQAVEMALGLLRGEPVPDRVIGMELKIRNSTSVKDA